MSVKLSTTRAPFGSWRSPIGLEQAVSGELRLREPSLVGDHAYWIEGRPSEEGRQILVRAELDGAPRDVIGAPFNVRSQVHEYGGGAYVAGDDDVFFSNFSDGRVYRLTRARSSPIPVTPEGEYRFADIQLDVGRTRLLCVFEDHSAQGNEATNTLVAVPLLPSGKEPAMLSTIASGADFYSSPRLSPDGSRLAWLAWSHPNMPWDGTELWVASMSRDGTAASPTLVAGGKAESIVQPEWSPDGRLHFVSDRSGWWNLYRWEDAEGATPLAPMEAELASPHWVFGMSSYGFTDGGEILAVARQDGSDRLLVVSPDGGRVETWETPFTDINYLRVAGDRAIFLGAGPMESGAIVVADVSRRELKVVRRAAPVELDPEYVSIPEVITFPTEDGEDAHALFYPPRNAEFEGPQGELPPLIVWSHGGPTGAASHALDPFIQIFTSRGFALVDVDYGGSTGYGRPYRERLYGRWGIVDVDDCVNAAKFLAQRRDVDARRVAIQGGSAGGYTTLCALTFRNFFAAGASYYGVADAESLARDTHKFESRYLDQLIGPYPEQVDLYRQRSPIHFTDRFSCPLIILQGLDDKVVPPAQAEAMVAALREKRIPHAYLAFEGEDHGFRQARNIRRSAEAVLSFYAQIFGFELADEIEPVAIEFLEAPRSVGAPVTT